MVFICVGGNHCLELLSKQFLCQLHANLVGHFRRDLPRLKALLQVVGQPAALFAKAQLGAYHLIGGGLPVIGRDKEVHA